MEIKTKYNLGDKVKCLKFPEKGTCVVFRIHIRVTRLGMFITYDLDPINGKEYVWDISEEYIEWTEEE